MGVEPMRSRRTSQFKQLDSKLPPNVQRIANPLIHHPEEERKLRGLVNAEEE